jgi:predicted TIM-barrel fold metal-dependent hydrolase
LISFPPVSNPNLEELGRAAGLSGLPANSIGSGLAGGSAANVGIVMNPADVPEVSTERKLPGLDVVDAQIHLRAGVDRAVAAMDAVGVQGAVVDIWPPETRELANGVTRYDYGFVEDARKRFPGRFAYMARLDPEDPEMDELMAMIAATPGAVCVRTHDGARMEVGGDGAMLAAAGRHRVPVMIYPARRHQALMRYVSQFDDVLFIVDHCGISVQEGFGGRLPEPAAFYIDALLQYASFPNVAVKWSHAPRLSRETYPYRDVIEQLLRMIDAFGVDRLMWGSDYTVTRDHHTYAEALFYLRHTDRLSESDKESLLGGTLRQLLRWPRGGDPLPSLDEAGRVAPEPAGRPVEPGG